MMNHVNHHGLPSIHEVLPVLGPPEVPEVPVSLRQRCQAIDKTHALQKFPAFLEAFRSSEITLEFAS